jgi:ABC-type transporter Mla maintaining outer membrane lipid asymmetry ATPase subunit MlaF
MSASAVIKVSGVVKGFGKQRVLGGVDLSNYGGECFGLWLYRICI